MHYQSLILLSNLIGAIADLRLWNGNACVAISDHRSLEVGVVLTADENDGSTAVMSIKDIANADCDALLAAPREFFMVSEGITQKATINGIQLAEFTQSGNDGDRRLGESASNTLLVSAGLAAMALLKPVSLPTDPEDDVAVDIEIDHITYDGSDVFGAPPWLLPVLITKLLLRPKLRQDDESPAEGVFFSAISSDGWWHLAAVWDKHVGSWLVVTRDSIAAPSEDAPVRYCQLMPRGTPCRPHGH